MINFHKAREIKARQGHLLSLSCWFTYQITSSQLFAFHIQPNNLHLTHEPVPNKSMQHKQSSTALLSVAAALTLISEPQNAVRKWDVPLEIGTTALSK